jgi:heat shock protein 4
MTSESELRYAHLTIEDREKVRAVWATAGKWLEDRLAAQEAKGKAELLLSCAEIEQRARTAANECLPILNKPVPAPAPAPAPAPEQAEAEKKPEEPAPAPAADGAPATAEGAGADAPAPAPEGEGEGEGSAEGKPEEAKAE